MSCRLLASLLFLSSLLWAADPTGTITGTVLDPSGAAVVGAKLVAANLNTGLSRESATANDGGYTFPLLPVGFYSITVQASGFRTFEQRGIEVRTDESSAVPVRAGRSRCFLPSR